jgi:methylated-DNA-[protein]-cysteine S-methyltransferase
MEGIAFTQFTSKYGKLRLVWRKGDSPKMLRIYLPNSITENTFNRKYGRVGSDSHPVINKISGRIVRFLNGEDVRFDLRGIDLDRCGEFQRSVLRAEYRIPRGWVSTYGRIAKSLGHPNGARAVGHALSNNPFPIIIPCHRAILSDGRLGGFQGGVKMKMSLLKAEGIEFSPSGRVIMKRVHY